MTKGWFKESTNHGLAAKGITSKDMSKIQNVYNTKIKEAVTQTKEKLAKLGFAEEDFKKMKLELYFENEFKKAIEQLSEGKEPKFDQTSFDKHIAKYYGKEKYEKKVEAKATEMAQEMFK